MSWQKIGEVVDAVGSGRKQLYNGKEYDYVFDVDVQEGAPPLKLPYNANGAVLSWIMLARPTNAERTSREPLQCRTKVPTEQRASTQLPRRGCEVYREEHSRREYRQLH